MIKTDEIKLSVFLQVPSTRTEDITADESVKQRHLANDKDRRYDATDET